MERRSLGKYFRHGTRPTGVPAGRDGRDARGKGAKDIINVSFVVKALLKIMERISRTTNFFLYARARAFQTPPAPHRACFIYKTPILSKTGRFFSFFHVYIFIFRRPSNLTRFDRRIFHPSRRAKGYPISPSRKINFPRQEGLSNRITRRDARFHLFDVYIYIYRYRYAARN